MTVFLLTTGTHDEYQVEAICSSREVAEKLIEEGRKAGNSWSVPFGKDNIRIEEWDMDSLGIRA